MRIDAAADFGRAKALEQEIGILIRAAEFLEHFPATSTT